MARLISSSGRRLRTSLVGVSTAQAPSYDPEDTPAITDEAEFAGDNFVIDLGSWTCDTGPFVEFASNDGEGWIVTTDGVSGNTWTVPTWAIGLTISARVWAVRSGITVSVRLTQDDPVVDPVIPIAFGSIVLSQISANTARATVTIAGNGPGVIGYRFKSNYTAEDQDDITLFYTISGPGTHIIESSSNLALGTDYTFLCYFNPDAEPVMYPAYPDVELSNEITMVSNSAPSAITPTTVTFTEGDFAIGQVFQTFSANEPGCVFAEGTPASDEIAVNAAGGASMVEDLEAGEYEFEVEATNAVGSFSETITLTVEEADAPPPPPAEELAPDVTVSTWALVLSQLASWAGNWNGTTPAGKTNADHRVVGYNGTQTMNVAFTGYRFPAAGVTVRGVGTFNTTFAGTNRITTGTPTITDCDNLRLYLLRFQGVSRALRWGGTCHNTGMERCHLSMEGDVALISSSPGYCIETIGSGITTNCYIKECVIGWARMGIYNTGWHTDMLFENIVFRQLSNDEMHSITYCDRPIIRGCWGARNKVAQFENPHEDFLQCRGGFVWTDALIEYNCLIEGAWSGTSAGGQQMFWMADGEIDGMGFYQNLGSMGHQLLECSGSGRDARYNTAHSSGSIGPSETRIEADSADFNEVAVTSSSGGGSGPHGVTYNVNSGVSAQVSGAPFLGDIGPTSMIGDYMPTSTSDRRHWNTTHPAGPVGCYLFRKELKDGTRNPLNRGWPTAHHWLAQYDADGWAQANTTNNYTGTYDSDGNNV